MRQCFVVVVAPPIAFHSSDGFVQEEKKEEKKKEEKKEESDEVSLGCDVCTLYVTLTFGCTGHGLRSVRLKSIAKRYFLVPFFRLPYALFERDPCRRVAMCGRI